MDTVGVSIIIFMIALFWMLFAAFKDHSSLKDGNHTDQKSIIVSIGVLGTFIGIALGLWEFDTSNIDTSVPNLLEGLKLAFATSIAGMFISISLSTFQKNKIEGGDDEIAILNVISKKLSMLTNLEQINGQLGGWRVEFRDTLKENKDITKHGFESLESRIVESNVILDKIPKEDFFNNFRNEIHEEQLKMRTFLQEQFVKTNDSLKEAIDVLSKGATEEIIKALETVITDFNKNLTEQFGDNFKELNSAVFNLLEWQKQYKEMIEKDSSLLIEIRASLNTSSLTIEAIAERNDEVRLVYEQLKTLIETSDTQVSSLNAQLEKYRQIGDEASKSFEALSGGFEKVQAGIGAQSEAIATLTRDISTQLPESLGQLENTLVGLTTQFGEDYKSFLENYKSLIQ